MRILLTILAALTLSAHAQEQHPMRLWYDQPARYFEESLPIGNGKLGALIYGGTDDNIIHLNDITLWTGKPVDQNEGAGAAEWIPEIRKALFNEDYRQADSLQLHIEGHNSEFYQPLGTLHLQDQNSGAVSNYRRSLSLDSAIVRECYDRDGKTVTREYFASHPDKLIAIRLTGDINYRLSLTAQVPHKVKAAGNQLTQTGHATGNPQESIHFCTMLRVKTDGQVTAADSSLTITNGREAVIYIVNETSFNGFDKHPVKEGAPYLERATDDIWHTENLSYEEFRQRHVSDYKTYYDRVKLRLGELPSGDGKGDKSPRDGKDDKRQGAEGLNVTTDRLLREHQDDRYLETLYFQYGRYLLISCSRTPGVPANLQGLWTPYLWSPWRGNYTVNINLEENYWPAFVANLAEMAEPLDNFIKALAENGQHTARNFYGVNQGWCSSHNSDLWAMTNPVGEQKESPMWSCWNMGGAWLVQTLWERYQFTQDKEYLRNVAYPLMQGAADFCLNWLIENPKQAGELITAPSTSPENEYVTDQGYHGVTCYGGTADLAIVRELLQNTIQAGSVCGRTTSAYQKALQRLHPYTIGKDGDLNEWYYDWQDWDPKHRHQSHLIGLYPGNHIVNGILNNDNGKWAFGTDALLKACEQTLIQKGDETTGWSTGWRINLWARLKNGAKAYQIYRKLLTFTDAQDDQRPGTRHAGGTYANLMDAHPPFQIDGNFGGTAGVCEMLMQSYSTGPAAQSSGLAAKSSGRAAQSSDVIELLPALPEEWKDGAVSGLKARGGYEVSFEWKDGRVRRVEIKASKKGAVTLLYNSKRKTLKMKAGQSLPIKIW